jgi:hypothetical protein
MGAHNNWQIDNKTTIIFDASFLLKPDEKFGGVKTFRTYLGPKYLSGFSDHLPIKIILKRRE